MKRETINRAFFILNKGFEEFSFRTYNLFHFTLPPRAIMIYPTEKCNLYCEMCFIRTIKKKFEELDFGIIKKLIKELNIFKPMLSLSGGEPTIYKYFFETVELIKKTGFDLTIVTNGVKLYEIADFLVETGVDKIKISIDGPPDVHNKIRGKNVFERIEMGIEEINEIKKKKKRKKPEIILHTVLNNKSSTNFIYDFGRKHNFSQIVFIPVLFLSKEDIDNFYIETGQKPHYWLGSNFPIDDFIIDEEMIKGIKDKSNVIFVPPVQNNLREYFERDKDFIDSFKGRCRSVFNSATIKPDGNVELCPDYVIGNLYNERFFKLWNNEKAKWIRKLVKSKNALSVCKGCCAYYRPQKI